MPSHVFISYKTEQRDRAKQVRQALAAATGLVIWWDQDLQTGGAWSEDLDRALLQAGAVVVLWSHQSVQSPWVLQEASLAKAYGRLVPVRLDDCEIPAPFLGIQTADLMDWHGEVHHDEFAKLVRAVRLQSRRRWPWNYLGSTVAGLAVGAGLVWLGAPALSVGAEDFSVTGLEELQSAFADYWLCVEARTDECADRADAVEERISTLDVQSGE